MSGSDGKVFDEVIASVGLSERRRQYKDRIVGDEDSARFHYDRTRLIDSVGREAQRRVDHRRVVRLETHQQRVGERFDGVVHEPVEERPWRGER